MKIGLISLGCPKNLVDSEVMLGLAQQAGHEITTDPSDADVLLVNTCAFVESAKQESIDAILEMAQHKHARPGRRLIVTGCLGQRYGAQLQAEMPEIDVVLGTGDVPRIVNVLDGEGSGPTAPEHSSPVALYRRRHVRLKPDPTPEERRHVRLEPDSTSEDERRHDTRTDEADADPVGTYARGRADGPRVASRHRSAAAQKPLPTYLYDSETPRVLTTPRHYAYVKIAEGCDYNCAFCIIPTLRGQYRSRPVESIVDEARALARRGVKELLLVSQDTTFYGIDRRERGALARLLRQLDGVDGIEWVRLLYLYPTTITNEVLDVMADLLKVCKYIDLPLQHSADGVLRRMRRPGNRGSYEALLGRIRQRVPGVALRTTFIVGFPGETRAEFEDLCDFVRTVQFDHVGVFTYSHEEGTAAFEGPDDVPRREKLRRRRLLMELQRGNVEARLRRLVGTTAKVLVDGPSADHELVISGRLEGQAPEIDSLVYLTGADPDSTGPGQIIDAQIVGHRGYDLVAAPLAAPTGV